MFQHSAICSWSLNWKGIDMFHYNAKQYALVADVTGSIAAKFGTKIILYYSLLLCDKTRNSESLVNTEILSDSQNELPIQHCLTQFILNVIIIPTQQQYFLHVTCRGQSLNLLFVFLIMNLLKNIFLFLMWSVKDVLLHQICI